MSSPWFKAKDVSIATVYYPASWQGWLVFLCGIALLALIFAQSDVISYSISDAFLNAAPPTIAVLLFTNWIIYKRCDKKK